MQDVFDRFVGNVARTAGRWTLSGILLGSLAAGAFTARLDADDTKVAGKVDDVTRTGNVKSDNQPLSTAITMARGSLDTIKQAKDYTCVFSKTEKVKDKMISQQMEMKFRQTPVSVYFRFHAPHSGREVIYVEGKNKGNFLVHEDGIKAIAGTFSLPPTGPDAMEENRYPITNAGMRIMLEIVVAQWEGDLKAGDTEVKFYPNAKVEGVECKLIETSHAKQSPQFKFQKTCLYIDKKTNLPIRVEQYGYPTAANQPAPLIEEYTYSNIKLNVGLGDIDFDVKNKNYKF